MQFICGYKSKEEITITTFHLPTRGLDLSTNHHIYQYDIIRFVVMGDIILVEDFNAQIREDLTHMRPCMERLLLNKLESKETS